MKDEEGEKNQKNNEKRLCTMKWRRKRVGRGGDIIYKNQRKERKGRNTYLV